MKNAANARRVSVGLLGLAGLVALGSFGLDGPQDQQPGSYAEKVLDHINVVAPENALGEADGRFAEIRPGGELTVLMGSRLYYSESGDDGAVVAKGDGRYGLAGLMQMDEEGAPAWQPLLPGRSPGGFRLSTDMFAAPQTTDTIKIVNDDTRPVFIDAVVGFKREAPARRAAF
jgi:hypothetical protein